MKGDRWLALLTDDEMLEASTTARMGESWALYVRLHAFGERFDRLYGLCCDDLEGQDALEFQDELYLAYIQCSDYSPAGWRQILLAVMAVRDRRIRFWLN